MKEKVKPKTLPGFMELLPNEQILFNKMKKTIQYTYEKFGFLPLDTPVIEDAKVLLAKAGGETEKQIYRFEKGDSDLALRFDLTVPLAEYYTDRKMPGVGISIGLSRLFFQLVDNNIISAEGQTISDVLIVSMTDDYDMCANIATKIRENGLNVQINMEDQKLGKKFKYADNLNVKYVVIIGEDEIKNNVVSLKNMNDGNQQTVSLEEAIKIIKE